MLRIMMAANSASPTDPIAAAILGKLTCWWELTEESGVRADVHGDAPLSPMDGVGVADGLRAGKAALLAGIATLDAPLVTSTSIPPGGGDHCVFGWFYLNANTGSQTFASNWDSANSTSMEYLARIESGNIDFYNGGSGYAFARRAVPTAGAWHFYVGWRDSTDGKVRLQVDNGAVAVSAAASNPTVQNRILRFGRMNGRIQRWGWIKGGILSAEERAWLYNEGQGRTYSEMVYMGYCKKGKGP